jgi:large subunit ribosomal protein L9
MANQQLLLVDDVDDLGRTGDIVTVKPGYARNFLLPSKRAVIADAHTVRRQAKLQQERAKQAAVDKLAAEEMAAQLTGKELTIRVKVDPEGHLYGSVTVLDLIELFRKEGFSLEKRNVVLAHPIKALGTFDITLSLKEGVPSQVKLHVVSETASQPAL